LCDDNIDYPQGSILWTTKAIQKYTPPPPCQFEVQGPSPDAEEMEDDYFEDDIQYLLSACGFVIGFGNFISFPNLMFSEGGFAFLIPYVLALHIIVIPLWTLETAWGQMIRCRMHHKFGIIHPKLQGLIAGMVSLATLTVAYYQVFFPWFFHYLFASFKSPFPWANDKNGEPTLWNPEYFEEDVLELSEDMGAPFKFVPLLVLLLIASYLLIYGTVLNGLTTAS